MAALIAETNVRVPDAAWVALNEIAAERGLSRDATIRDLLDAHIAEQALQKPEDRLTHISTLLRHPAPPEHRGAPRPGRLLRLRVAPGTIDRARAVSLRLPGQPERRGHRDYQARRLADAVVTAIAREQEFTDDILQGLLPLIRQGAAIGLWRLAAAATYTASERAVFRAASAASGDKSPAGLRAQNVAEELRDAEVSWHDPWRIEVVRHLAGKMLVRTPPEQPARGSHEQILRDQQRPWLKLRRALETYPRDPEGRWLLAGLSGTHQDLEGRGGTAVWRAERNVDVDDFGYWLIGEDYAIASAPEAVTPSDTRERVMRPPGWRLEQPAGWLALSSPPGAPPPPQPWLTLARAGRVMHFEFQSRHVLWPVQKIPNGQGHQPVPGFDAVVHAAPDLPALTLIERVLVRFDSDRDAEIEYLDWVRVPVYRARGLELIDENTKDEIVAAARGANIAQMQAVMDAVQESDHEARSALRAAISAPSRFAAIAASHGGAFHYTRPEWVWPVRSVAAEVVAGTSPDAVAWLTDWVSRRCALGLEQAMQRAWREAFARYHPVRHGYVTSTVNRC